MNTYLVDKTFENIDFREQMPEPADYENCTFINCTFSDVNLSESVFEECDFEQCDLSNARLVQTAFKNVHFKSCKLIGLQFDTCNQFLLEFRFEECILNYASFYGLKIPKSYFSACSLLETDFRESDLAKAVFSACQLGGAMFENTNLQGADMRNNKDITLSPELNHIWGAKFSLENLPGLLQKYNIKVD